MRLHIGVTYKILTKMEEAGEDKRKQKHPDSHPSKCQDKEDEVDTNFHELREKHNGDTYETPQLCFGLQSYNVGLMMIMMIHPCTNDNWNLT